MAEDVLDSEDLQRLKNYVNDNLEKALEEREALIRIQKRLEADAAALEAQLKAAAELEEGN